jgi:hypothetical protein
MNRYLSLLFVAFVLAPRLCAAEWEWRSRLQIKQVAMAVQLVDFPLPQGRLHTVIGTKRLPNLFILADDRGKPYGTIALTDPETGDGYFAIRVHYDLVDPLPAIGAIEFVFVSADGATFLYEPGQIEKKVVPDLKKKMRERGETPIAFAEWSITEINEPPNKALEPTPTSVTDRAAHAPRQP